MLFTGDIEFLAEAELLNENISAQVLKAAHHGSKTSSAYNFLQAVNPQVILISCAKNNKFGHPHAQSITAYKKFTKKIFCTAYNGTITIDTDGETFSVSPQFNIDWQKNFKPFNKIITVEKIDL